MPIKQALKTAAQRNTAMAAQLVAAADHEDEPSAAAPEPPAPAPQSETAAALAHPTAPSATSFDAGKIDGRTLRRTGREPVATRIKPEAHEALRRRAYERGISIGEVIERMVAAPEILPETQEALRRIAHRRRISIAEALRQLIEACDKMES